MAATDNARQSLVVTAFWEVNSGEEGAVADLLKDFLPQAQQEPGVKEFQIHQNVLSTLAECTSLLRSLVGEDR